MRNSLVISGLLAVLHLICGAAAAAEGMGDRNFAVLEPGMDEETLVQRAVEVHPSPRQLAWQELEFIAFIHFGVNAFTNREWGDGKEDPAIFDPSDFDAKQWVDVCKSAGMKALILTCKHHDGFCLWPSRYTEHSVKKSPWKNGAGDLVREVSDACRAGGIGFGVYLSPWDRNQPCYGDSPRYNAYFTNQLRELLTQYGEVSEVWFDGACGEGPNGKRQVYDWPAYFAVVRELQPDAVISIVGPDIRWCGNEAGRTRESEWSVVPMARPDDGTAKTIAEGGDPAWRGMGASGSDDDLGSRERIRDAWGLMWYPSQVNTSIRPGWFYHPEEDDRVKSLEHLLDVYYGSVGGNAQFLLNFPPDRRGRIHENDAARMTELGKVLGATFEDNLAASAETTASALRGNGPDYAASNTVDDNPHSYWMTDDGVMEASIELDLGGPATFNRAMLQEHIALGQRIEAHALDVWTGSEWKEIAASTVVGYKRLLRFEAVTANRVRLRIIQSRVCPTLSHFGLYLAPTIQKTPAIARDSEGTVTITAQPGETITYRLAGWEPDAPARSYSGPFPLPEGGTLKVSALPPADGKYLDLGAPLAVDAQFGLARSKLKVHYASSEQSKKRAADLAIDGDADTFWHTARDLEPPPEGHELVLDLGKPYPVAGLTYLPRQDMAKGRVVEYAFYVGNDPKRWPPAALRGAFGNMENNPVLRSLRLEKPATGRYVRFVGQSSVGEKPYISLAELEILVR